MANVVLVIGESGTGKTTSLETLPPEKTFIILVEKEELPFRGWKKNYKPLDAEGKGNYFKSDKHDDIIKILKYVSDKRSDIEYLIVDDFIYTMVNEYMRRSNEKSFDKFTEIAVKAHKVVQTAKSLRENLNVAILTHSEEYMDSSGIRKQKIKTIGKLLDNQVNLEGMLTTVLYTDVENTPEGNKYSFLTQNKNNSGKTPKGMFEDLKIPNDLKLVFDTITKYNND